MRKDHVAEANSFTTASLVTSNQTAPYQAHPPGRKGLPRARQQLLFFQDRNLFGHPKIFAIWTSASFYFWVFVYFH